jgi:hypothetical protein
MTRKQIKGSILKHNYNVERLNEHIRQHVARELSCEWWLREMCNGYEMLVAKGEGKLLEDCGI